MAINIKALRDQRAEKAREARNLLDTNTTGFTKDIETQVDALYEEIDRIDAQIDRAERQARIDGGVEADARTAEAGERARATLTPEQRERDDRYSAAFRSYLLYGVSGMSRDDMTLLREGRAPQNAQSGQQANGAQGGYLVPTGWGGELLEALAEFGGMREVAHVWRTAGGNPVPWPTVDETGVEGEQVAENVAATAQDFTFGTTQIGAYKFSSKIVTIPFELLQDQGAGIDIEAFTRRALATRIARITNRKFTTGSGVGEPQGVFTVAPVGVVGAAGTATSVLPDAFIDLEHAVDPAYRRMPGVRYMFNDATLRSAKKLKDGQGNYIWKPGFNIKEPDTINGYAYTINQQSPAMAANAKSILFGDFSQYMIRDVMEVTLFRFDDSAFTIKGQVGFLAWSRHDGRLVSAGQPIKAYQNGPN